jgi:quinoprotein glucose dehydrogenase
MTSRNSRKSLRTAALLAVYVVGSMTGTSAQSSRLSTSTGEWPSNGGTLLNDRYSSLDQINASNFSQLQVAWRFKTDSLGPRPEFKLEGTPLMVNGVIYTTAGSRRAVVALDAVTGELLWMHAEREGARAAASPRQLSGHGVAYWSDGQGDDRILYVTPGYRLVALNAKTGTPIESFATKGMFDLKKDVVFGSGEPIDLVNGEIGLHATPAVTRSGVVLVGSAFKEGYTPKTHNNTKGLVQAFDVRTGKKLWQFNTIPRPGEFGNDTWLNNSWATNGNTGVWTQIAVDEELGLAYLPVEDATGDFYGGHRPGDNLFADSIVCVDLKTGVRKWHFQLVHHPMWDMDIAAPPVLIDITVDGRPIKAVAVTSKQVFMYVFDRVTGKPVWPIEERPVPQSSVAGEKTSATQPFPTKPPAFDFQGVSIDDLIDFTPELRAEAVKLVSKYKLGPVFTPPVESKAEGPFASFRSAGGVNWPGFAFDAETHIAYVPSYNALNPVSLIRPASTEVSDMDFVQGDIRPQAPRPLVQGLPLMKPPYGRLSAINLDKGEILWQVPLGETPDAVRNSPALKGLNIPRTGQSGLAGVLVTKTLVIVGEPQFTTTPDHPKGAMLRAYDKVTGKEVGAVWMPAPQSGNPMTYSVAGKQYLIVPVSGAQYTGEYLAFSLPK